MKKKAEYKNMASGQGGDEIYSNLQNYHFGSSNPKKFPKKLNKVFSLGKFYYGAQSSYLAKKKILLVHLVLRQDTHY